MILINQTFLVDPSLEKEWNAWIRLIYIPLIVKTGFYLETHIFKLLEGGSTDGVTYALQFGVKSSDLVEMCKARFEEEFEPMIASTFGEQVLSFRTLLSKE